LMYRLSARARTQGGRGAARRGRGISTRTGLTRGRVPQPNLIFVATPNNQRWRA
jgi:hypothetical protein